MPWQEHMGIARYRVMGSCQAKKGSTITDHL